jgi:hypothetical protein
LTGEWYIFTIHPASAAVRRSASRHNSAGKPACGKNAI